MTKHIFEGGCHCGRVRFEVTVDKLEALDCNCSICKKKGFLHVIVPHEQFRLLTDRSELSTYTFNTGEAKHHFCRTCGVHPFYIPRSHPDGVDVNLRCLELTDADATTAEFTIVPFDGANWEQNVEDIR
jgi:hypothetical protein